MTRTLGPAIAVSILVVVLTAPCLAAETPHALWVKAKCALCHGEDGRGDTPSGKQTHVPDLRSDEVQKKSDEELAKAYCDRILRCTESGIEDVTPQPVRRRVKRDQLVPTGRTGEVQVRLVLRDHENRTMRRKEERS